MIKAIIVGEVLFDILPDGREILGGAPFNVAWNLKALGIDPIFVSRIGSDIYGERILRAMESWRLDRSGIQIDSDHPTGGVKVTLQKGEPSYDIRYPAAYDFLDWRLVDDILHDHKEPLLYHGSLILRNETSYHNFLDCFPNNDPVQKEVFIDINLRRPWYHPEKSTELLRNAKYVKLNEEELSALFDLKYSTQTDFQEKLIHLYKKMSWQSLILTLGEKGAILIHKDLFLHREAPPVPSFRDAIGAGDAFSSMIIYGLQQKIEMSKILNIALDYAAHICTLTGATSQDAIFYRKFIEKNHKLL